MPARGYAVGRLSDAADAPATAGFRPNKENGKIYRDAYKDTPKLLELVKTATK